jgi:hypothetical protein
LVQPELLHPRAASGFGSFDDLLQIEVIGRNPAIMA